MKLTRCSFSSNFRHSQKNILVTLVIHIPRIRQLHKTKTDFSFVSSKRTELYAKNYALHPDQQDGHMLIPDNTMPAPKHARSQDAAFFGEANTLSDRDDVSKRIYDTIQA